VGAVIAYEVGRSAGRTIVERWGKWLLLSTKDLDRRRELVRALRLGLGVDRSRHPGGAQFHLGAGRHGRDEPRALRVLTTIVRPCGWR